MKAALSSQLFKDPKCWSGRGLNPRPPAQQTGALPTELTRRNYHFCERIFIKISSSIAVSEVLRCILNSSHVLTFSTICENVSLKLTFAVNLILDLSMSTNHISPSFWRLLVRRLSSVCDREFSLPLVLFVNTAVLYVPFYGLPAKVTIDKGKDFK